MMSPSRSPIHGLDGQSRAHPSHDAAWSDEVTGAVKGRWREPATVTLNRIFPVATVVAVVSVTAAIDLVTKVVAMKLLAGGVARNLMPMLDLSLAFNRGISFSLFQAHDPASLVVLLGIQGALTCLVIWWAVNATEALQRFGFSAIAGGAVANVLDRFINGTVTDILDLHTAGIRWFTFNLADVWISAGVVLLILDALPVWFHRTGVPGGLTR